MTSAASTAGTRPVRAEPGRPVALAHLGTVGYLDAWELQRRLVDARRDGAISDTLLLLEHPPVYTMGRRTDRAHLLWDAEERASRGIDLVEVDRGGDVTYHGPGQLVGYPIVRLASSRSVVGYVRALEAALIDALGALGVQARRSEGYTGVWVGNEKIAAIGVRVAVGGVTSHGFALNVHPDLGDFGGIVPCGISDRGVCSLATLGFDVDLDIVAAHVVTAFSQVFDATIEPVRIDALLPHAEASA